MEMGTHDIMVVACEHCNTTSGLPIPDADRLIIGGTQDPRIFIMKLHRSDVIQMAQQGEDTPPQLVVPDLDLVVITTRDKQGL